MRPSGETNEAVQLERRMVAVRTLSSQAGVKSTPCSVLTRSRGKSWKVHIPASPKTGVAAADRSRMARMRRRMTMPFKLSDSLPRPAHCAAAGPTQERVRGRDYARNGRGAVSWRKRGPRRSDSALRREEHQRRAVGALQPRHRADSAPERARLEAGSAQRFEPRGQ